jgi:hypothetical protein
MGLGLIESVQRLGAMLLEEHRFRSKENLTMPKPSTGLTAEKLKELALVGAEHALKELRAEIAAIEAAFPELGRGGHAVRQSVATATKRARKMSAAARKAVSKRMTRYWAERRKAKAKVKA